MDRITEIKTALSGRVDEFGCDVVERSDRHVVVIYRLPAARDLHGLGLPAGTVTVGYFWTERPYNLYHWIGPDGATLAYYFNVGDVTRLEAGTLAWRDLAVDVLATPDGRVRVLDEDELPADLDAGTRAYVERARDEILAGLPELVAAAERDTAQVFARVTRT